MRNHKLLRAAKVGDVAEIRAMVEKGAYLETRRPFIMTPEKHLLSIPKTRRSKGLTPLMYAAQGGYHEACQELLLAGASLDAEDEDGQRPLHFAASSGCLKTCQVLLSAGADPATQDDDGHTALAHVSPADMATPAEKKSWQALLGPGAQPPTLAEDSEVVAPAAAVDHGQMKNRARLLALPVPGESVILGEDIESFTL
jgi:hypothetical protein